MRLISNLIIIIIGEQKTSQHHTLQPSKQLA